MIRCAVSPADRLSPHRAMTGTMPQVTRSRAGRPPTRTWCIGPVFLRALILTTNRWAAIISTAVENTPGGPTRATHPPHPREPAVHPLAGPVAVTDSTSRPTEPTPTPAPDVQATATPPPSPTPTPSGPTITSWQLDVDDVACEPSDLPGSPGGEGRPPRVVDDSRRQPRRIHRRWRPPSGQPRSRPERTREHPGAVRPDAQRWPSDLDHGLRR